MNQNFSVFQHVLHSASCNIFSDNYQLLWHWCSSIEQSIIEQSIPLTLFAGFQKLDYFVPVMERYQKIAQVANHVYIFGEPSKKVEPIPNLTYVHLSHHMQLRNECFLVAYHEGYSRALIAQETIPPNGAYDERRLKGVYTSDVRIIEPSYRALMEQVVPSV